MKAKLLVLSLLLMISKNLWAAPSFVFEEHFGDVPIDIDGISQKITKPLTICKSSSSVDSRPLSFELLLASGASATWELDKRVFNPAGSDCQTFNITMTPTATGTVTGAIVVSGCMLGTKPCSRTLELEANVITSAEYQQHIASGTYNTGRIKVIDAGDNRLASAQPLFLDHGQRFMLVGAEIALDFTIDSQRNLRVKEEGSEIRFPGAANSLLCNAGSSIYEYLRFGAMRLRAKSGHILGRSQSDLLRTGSMCSTGGTRERDGIRIVPAHCARQGLVSDSRNNHNPFVFKG